MENRVIVITYQPLIYDRPWRAPMTPTCFQVASPEMLRKINWDVQSEGWERHKDASDVLLRRESEKGQSHILFVSSTTKHRSGGNIFPSIKIYRHGFPTFLLSRSMTSGTERSNKSLSKNSSKVHSFEVVHNNFNFESLCWGMGRRRICVLTLQAKNALVPICEVTLLMPFPSRYGPVMNVVPWLIETDDEFPSARIKSANREREKERSVLVDGNVRRSFQCRTLTSAIDWRV